MRGDEDDYRVVVIRRARPGEGRTVEAQPEGRSERVARQRFEAWSAFRRSRRANQGEQGHAAQSGQKMAAEHRRVHARASPREGTSFLHYPTGPGMCISSLSVDFVG